MNNDTIFLKIVSVKLILTVISCAILVDQSPCAFKNNLKGFIKHIKMEK